MLKKVTVITWCLVPLVMLSGCAVAKFPGQVLKTVGQVVTTTGKVVETAGKVVVTGGEVAKSVIKSPAADAAIKTNVIK